MEGAEKSEADRDRLLATSWIGAIASMYAFANGVSGGGPWPPGMSTMLGWAWVLMGLSALIVTISHDVSARAHRHALIRFDDGERQPQPGGASRKRLVVCPLNKLTLDLRRRFDGSGRNRRSTTRSATCEQPQDHFWDIPLEVLNRLVWIPFVLGWLVALAVFLRFGG